MFKKRKIDELKMLLKAIKSWQRPIDKTHIFGQNKINKCVQNLIVYSKALIAKK